MRQNEPPGNWSRGVILAKSSLAANSSHIYPFEFTKKHFPENPSTVPRFDESLMRDERPANEV